jgi:hypothetical protein
MPNLTPTVDAYLYTSEAQPPALVQAHHLIISGCLDDLRIPRRAPASLRYPADWSPAGIAAWLHAQRLTPCAVTLAGIRPGQYWYQVRYVQAPITQEEVSS